MGNTREWTTKFNARNAALSEFVKSRAGRSMSKRKAAVEKAATMENRLPPLKRNGGGR